MKKPTSVPDAVPADVDDSAAVEAANILADWVISNGSRVGARGLLGVVQGIRAVICEEREKKAADAAKGGAS